MPARLGALLIRTFLFVLYGFTCVITAATIFMKCVQCFALYDSIGIISFILPETITTHIYFRKNLHSFSMFFSKKNVKNWSLYFVIVSGFVMPWFLSAWFVFLSTQEGSDVKSCNYAVEARIFQIFLAVVFPTWYGMMSINAAIYVLRVQKFLLEASLIEKNLKEINHCWRKQSDNIVASFRKIDTQFDKLKSDFSPVLFLQIFTLCVSVLTSAGYVINDKDFYKHVYGTLSSLLNIIAMAGIGVVTVEWSVKVEQVFKNVGRAISDLVIREVLSEHTRHYAKVLKEIRFILMYKNYGLSASGFFNVNRRLLVTVAGACITYCVVMYQFRQSLA